MFAYDAMSSSSSTECRESPARLGALLGVGILAGLVAATAHLADGGGWLAALGLYSLAGSCAVLAAATLKALHCSLLRERPPAPSARP